ncbi:AAA family ATPase [Kitasatospora sp. NBC_00315]|uniref:AAA family ATPase n=1 Tax=Kitasatospora sp. NBC_00315 TaxID=2975963 RepID=UPI00324E006A
MGTTDEAGGPAARTTVPDDGEGRPRAGLRPRGLVDLRGWTAPHGGAPVLLIYPADAVVIVSGLPGSGKSTLLHRWSADVPVVDPRAVHLACEALMPHWLPYPVYRPWARLEHVRWLRAAVGAGGPLLVHDCGSRRWMRRWLARGCAVQGREVHLVLLDVGAEQALAGQRARGRWARRRVFDRHRRGLDRLLAALPTAGAAAAVAAVAPGTAGTTGTAGAPGTSGTTGAPGTADAAEAAASRLPAVLAEMASVTLLDRVSRERAAAAFDSGPPEPSGPREP